MAYQLQQEHMAHKLIVCCDRSVNPEQELKVPLKEHCTPGTHNTPKKRQALILKALTQNEILAKLIDVHTLDEARVDAPLVDSLLSTIHEESYIVFVKRAFESAVAAKDTDWLNEKEQQLLPNHFARPYSTSHRQLLLEVLPAYKQSGLFGSDSMTPIGALTWKDARRAAANSIQAAQLAVAKKSTFNEAPVVYALNGVPGHHASSNSYGGYCFFNNAGLAAQASLLELPTSSIHDAKVVALPCAVVILNLDYHHSDGTAQIFYRRGDVGTVSLHAHPVIDYPSFNGFETQTGEGPEGTGRHLNLPLPKGTNGAKYLKALEKALKIIADWTPQTLIIEFGGDTYKDDPDPSANKGGFKLDLVDYRVIGRTIRAHAGKSMPIVVTQEGGYHEMIGQIVNEFLTGLCC